MYLHFPFCAAKCPYCDFYSSPRTAAEADAYTAELKRRVSLTGERLAEEGELPRGVPGTLYLGGGTPTLLPAGALSSVIAEARRAFGDFREVTVEANPAENLRETFAALRGAGVNRVSVGAQSAVPEELRRLGRRHTVRDIERAVTDARAAGIADISLDIMLGVPGQTERTLSRTLEFCLAARPEHISAYILKIEPATPLGKAPPPDLPGDDETADLYLLVCERLREAGYRHYEISNFGLPGHESLHNLKYWTLSPYVGLGPGAHGYLRGKRYFYRRDFAGFLAGSPPVFEGDGGGREEFVMLRSRLSEGFEYEEYASLYGGDLREHNRDYLSFLREAGLLQPDSSRFALTEKGFLVQNAILTGLK